jgi:tetratricopeptide (TPR) repeat protein
MVRRPETDDTVASADSEKPELAATYADTGSASRASQPVVLTRGAPIGRYMVVDQLGAGGMGTVYVAYDPELDRKVAIKVLRSADEGTNVTAGRARMMREAQAIARLAHPNVVAVYDVGPVAEHQVFIAMELVEGATLAAWLQEDKRTIAEILAVFVQAGRGLAAAHHAGLVHRDFKPENVLVGKDGRARVLDFGLVREADAPTEPTVESALASEPRNSALSVTLTHVGTMMGTPRYMSPEQRARRTADARSDQYSFCVSLYEAIHGRLPDVDTAPVERVSASDLKSSRSVPAAVRAAIRRGLSEDPEARWPNLDELLAVLARDPSARRRAWLVGGGAVVAAGGVAGALVLALRGHAGPDACGGASERFAEVWGDPQRAALERAFTATHAPFAAASLATVSHELDAYGSAWRHTYEDSCRATHVRHEQSAELLDLRSACLANRRTDVGALVDLFKEADTKVVRNAVAAVSALPPIADCDDVTALQSPVRMPAEPEKRKAIDDARTELARVDALFAAGRYKDALARATALYERVRTVAYRPLTAEVALLLGKIQNRSGENAAADRTFREALAASIAAHADDDVLYSATSLALSASELTQLPRADEWIAVSVAASERLGNPPLVLAHVYGVHAHVLATAGKLADAVAEQEKARDLREKVAPGSLELGNTLTGLAYEYDEVGRYGEARAAGERSLEIKTAKLGPDHPDIALTLNNLGNVAADEGNPEAARKYYERALAIRERTVAEGGDDPRGIAMVANNLGALAFDAEHLDEALRYFHRAIEVHEKLDPTDPEMTLPMIGIAQVHLKRHEYKDALPIYRRALSIVEAKLGKEHPYAGDDLVGIGRCLLELGQLDEAQAALERSLAIRKKDARPTELGEVEFELGKLLWVRGAKPRALELVKAAHEQYETSKASASAIAEIDQWTHEHVK